LGEQTGKSDYEAASRTWVSQRERLAVEDETAGRCPTAWLLNLNNS